ncbi:Proteolipid membrane potential modulator domain containing protein [Hyaloscypha variabilis]|uniref:Uncharacterized protein n=1 Tax=Hyaloscypha variabilis (strain UAMH 11265 / GT02V1 / F) TaxID=1149755 RepID=A0A2J6RKD1_HYAVF|nr:hypothetical protein L207DRAFT_513459 [Hyaloscypha variabilis F]
MSFVGLACLILITIFIPPLGVFIVAGCGADLLINILLTFLGFIPGHFHAFYIIFVDHHRKNQRKRGIPNGPEAPLIFSDRVQYGGRPVAYPPQNYGPRY